MAIDPKVARAMVRSLRNGLQGDPPAAQAPKRWFTREQLHERIFERIRELGIPLDSDGFATESDRDEPK